MNLALFDVDTLAQAMTRAVGDGDAAALAGYSTWWCHTCGAIREFSAWMTDSMHDVGGPALNGPLRQMTALAGLDELFDSSVAGRLYNNHLRGVAWQAGLPMPA